MKTIKSKQIGKKETKAIVKNGDANDDRDL